MHAINSFHAIIAMLACNKVAMPRLAWPAPAAKTALGDGPGRAKFAPSWCLARSLEQTDRITGRRHNGTQKKPNTRQHGAAQPRKHIASQQKATRHNTANHKTQRHTASSPETFPRHSTPQQGATQPHATTQASKTPHTRHCSATPHTKKITRKIVTNLKFL